MSARPSRWLGLSTVCVFALALTWLVMRLFGLDDAELSMIAMFGGPYLLSSALALLIVAGLRAALIADPERRERACTETLLIPCVLAPLAVMAPWFIAPSHFGTALVDLPYFVDWLTRYPTVGPINHEVALGIGALLGASATPAFFAAYAARVPQVGARSALGLVLLQLVAYVPVFLRLDLDLFGYALMTAVYGPVSLFAPDPEGSLGLGLAIASGALLRLAATASMLAIGIRALRRRDPPIWES